MKVFSEVSSYPDAASSSQGQVIRGQYAGALRSKKGKLKGLWLRTATQEYAIKLPKYLRPVLARELPPEALIQVWVYPHKGIWQAINIAPLSATEGAALPTVDVPALVRSPQLPSQACLRVCQKGTCSKRGSNQVWQSLQAEIEANPELAGITLKGTGCLKACKQGPNVKLPSGEVVSVGHPASVRRVLKTVEETQCG